MGFWLVAPAALAAAESNLPACCRRNGKHRCAMGAERSQPASGPSFAAVWKVCASFPAAITAPATARAAVHTAPAVLFAPHVSHRATLCHSESRYCAAFRRCRQMRGPPSLLS
jgi:hypothetical protein